MYTLSAVKAQKIQNHEPSFAALSHVFLTAILSGRYYHYSHYTDEEMEVKKDKSPKVSQLVHGRTWMWLTPNPCNHVLARLLSRRHTWTQFSKERKKEHSRERERCVRSLDTRVVASSRNPIWIITAENELIQRAVSQGQTQGIPTF